jgi:hypothetical protein
MLAERTSPGRMNATACNRPPPVVLRVARARRGSTAGAGLRASRPRCLAPAAHRVGWLVVTATLVAAASVAFILSANAAVALTAADVKVVQWLAVHRIPGLIHGVRAWAALPPLDLQQLAKHQPTSL